MTLQNFPQQNLQESKLEQHYFCYYHKTVKINLEPSAEQNW